MYSDVVLGIEINQFEKHLERAKQKQGVKQAKGYTKQCIEIVLRSC